MNPKIIKNYEQLASSPLRKRALQIIEAAYQALDLAKIVPEKIQVKGKNLFIQGQKFELPAGHLYLLGIGKGSWAIIRELEKVLAKMIAQGLVLDVEGGKLKHVRGLRGTHPLPSAQNIKATQEIVEILEKAGQKDLLLFVICGGGSALASAPYQLKIDALRKINQSLIRSGASIGQINTIRKHLSYFKGGGAAKTAYPARLISLIVSDVPGNDLGTIASGPTIKDESTKAQAQAIAKNLGLPPLDFLETPKQEKYFKRVTNLLFLSNKVPLKAMKLKAQDLGYQSQIYSFQLQGEAKRLGPQLLARARANPGPFALLVGGEWQVKVLGQGRGGRNQELVLAALPHLKKGELIASFASDGWDNSEAAGALADELTLKKAKAKKLEPKKYLAENNSFPFFEKTRDLIFTGRRLNLADLALILKP